MNKLQFALLVLYLIMSGCHSYEILYKTRKIRKLNNDSCFIELTNKVQTSWLIYKDNNCCLYNEFSASILSYRECFIGKNKTYIINLFGKATFSNCDDKIVYLMSFNCEENTPQKYYINFIITKGAVSEVILSSSNISQ